MLNQRPTSLPRPEDNNVTSPDLSTTYLGFRLSNPLVVSASPLGHDLDNLKRMEDAGAAAIVLPSLFEEQIVHGTHELDYFLAHGTYSFAEALTHFPEPHGIELTPQQPDIDLELLQIVSRPTLSPTGDEQSLRLPLNWIGILDGRVHASLAASSGIHTATDVLKLLLVGADVTMFAPS
jgi:dihydroorotate dehydrogenase